MPTCDGVNDVVQIVAAPTLASPAVINFNSGNLFYYNWSAPPVKNEGPILQPDRHPGRVIDFDLNVDAASADANSAALQAAVRLIQRGEAWLKFQKAGATSPVFFKLRPSDLTSVTEFWTLPGDRQVHVALLADPYAWGVQVTGSATIQNDPSTGTNRMQLVMPTIQGDVPTPLHLSFNTVTPEHKILWASESNLFGAVAATPIWKDLTTLAIDTTPFSSWTVSDVADSSAIGGTRRAIAKSNSATPYLFVPTDNPAQTWTPLPVGEYRVMVRAIGARVDTQLLFFNQAPKNGSLYTYEEAVAYATVGASPAASGHHDWFDLGVVSLPGGAPPDDILSGLANAPTTAVWSLGVYSEVATTISLDSIVLIPAGRSGVITRHGTVSFADTFTSKAVTVDGINHRRFAAGQPLLTPGVTVPVPPLDLTGATPLVSPGATAANCLTFFATVANGVNDRADDSKTLSTTLTWRYYPLYVNDRPAST